MPLGAVWLGLTLGFLSITLSEPMMCTFRRVLTRLPRAKSLFTPAAKAAGVCRCLGFGGGVKIVVLAPEFQFAILADDEVFAVFSASVVK